MRASRFWSFVVGMFLVGLLAWGAALRAAAQAAPSFGTAGWPVSGGMSVAGGGGGGMVIGDPVTGGTPNSVLYVDPSGNLGEDATVFAYDETGTALYTPNIYVSTAAFLWGATTIGSVVADTVQCEAGAWTFPNATTFAVDQSLNFDSNLFVIDSPTRSVSVGVASNAASGSQFEVNRNVDSKTGMSVVNENTGTGAAATYSALNDDGAYMDMTLYGSNYALPLANRAMFENFDGTGIGFSMPPAGDARWYTYNGAVYTEHMRLSSTVLQTFNNTTFGDASGDAVTSTAASWSFPSDTAVSLGGGVDALNFDANTLSIDALNNWVGVGRADPVSLLTVGASNGVSGSDSNKLLYVGENTASTRAMRFENALVTWDLVASTDGTGYVGTFNNTPLALTQNNIARVYVNGTNVGIGPDTTPDTMLDVQGTANVEGNFTMGDASGDSVTSNAASWSFPNDTAVSLGGGVNGLNFDSDTLVIDSTNDRVIIGAAAAVAGAKFEVVRTADTTTQMYIVNQSAGTSAGMGYGALNNAGNYAFFGFYGSNYSSIPAYANRGVWESNRALGANFGTASDMRWFSNPGSTEHMIINTTGLQTLDNTTFGNASGDAVTSNAAAWSFPNDTTVSLGGGVNGINFDSNTLSIDAANNRVGIGTAAPLVGLDVETTDAKIGRIDLTSSVTLAGNQTYNLPDNAGSQFTILEGATEYLDIDTSNGSERFAIGATPVVTMSNAANISTCTLDGASPSTCTITVLNNSKCQCSPVGTTAAIAAGGCAVSVATTTLTITGPNGATNDVNSLCFAPN